MKNLVAVLIAIALPLCGQKEVNGNRIQGGTINACPGTSGTDTYACALGGTLAQGYFEGLRIQFKPDVANTGAASLNVNGLGDKTVVKVSGGVTTTLASNDLLPTQMADLVYDANGNFQLQSTLGNAPAAGSTQYSAILSAPGAVVAASSTRYNSIYLNWQVNVASAHMPFPAAGTLSNLHIRTTTAQPSSGALTCTIQVGEGTDTGITVTIAANAAAATFADLVNTAAITVGQSLALKCVNAATASSANVLYWTLRLQQ